MGRRVWQRVDLLLLLGTVLLLAFGLGLIYSASHPAETPVGWRWDWGLPVVRQLLYALLGLALLFLVAGLDYRIYGPLSWFFFGFMTLSLVIVLLAGTRIYGARRWLDFGIFDFQPSELAKLLIILILAKYFADREGNTGSWRVTLGSLAIVGVPGMLVYLQPDLGTALVFMAVWLGIAATAGVRLLHLAGLGVLGLISLPLVYRLLLHPYMRERLAVFLNPLQDPLGAGYNVLQSEISVGAGGFLGKGFLNGTQTQLQFLRTQSTDFIFSVLAEELGFVGGMVIFGLFLLLLFRGLRAASLAQDRYGRFIAVGVVTMLLFQAFLSVGMNVRLLPVAGVPLPLLSSGGSSLMTTLMALGLLQSIVIRHKRLEF